MTDQNSGATPPSGDPYSATPPPPSSDPYAATPPPAAPSNDPYAVPSATPYAESQPYTGAPAAPAKAPVLSIISTVAGGLGVLGGFAVFWIPVVGPILQFWLPTAAVILGFMGKKREPRAKGLWLTGIITGFVGLLLFVIGIIITIAAFAFLGSGDYSDFETY